MIIRYSRMKDNWFQLSKYTFYSEIQFAIKDNNDLSESSINLG